MIMCDSHVNQLRDKIAHWNDCLNGDDVNSITNQLTRLTWDITAFRILVEAYELAQDEKERRRRFNGFPFRLLHKCFSESLLMGFRRLMDNERLEGKLGVYSLRSLLRDISEHAYLLTRNAIIRLGPPAGSSMIREDWARSKNRTIDNVIAVTEQERSPHDTIPAEMFERMKETLEQGFATAEKLVNKTTAHAATPQSREGISIGPITIDDVYTFHANLCKSTHVLQCLIMDSSLRSFLPSLPPSADDFERLSEPLITDHDVTSLVQRWEELAQECASWSNWLPGDDHG